MTEYYFAMVHLSSDEVAVLKKVAREVRDTTDEHGYKVNVAVRQHDAFSSSRVPLSALERTLVLDAARRVPGWTSCAFGSPTLTFEPGC